MTLALPWGLSWQPCCHTLHASLHVAYIFFFQSCNIRTLNASAINLRIYNLQLNTCLYLVMYIPIRFIPIYYTMYETHVHKRRGSRADWWMSRYLLKKKKNSANFVNLWVIVDSWNRSLVYSLF